jgi:hypothetical protein
MKHSEKAAPAKPRQPSEHHFALQLEDDQAFKERGYDPYATVVHVKDTRAHDIWRTKPKRA